MIYNNPGLIQLGTKEQGGEGVTVNRRASSSLVFGVGIHGNLNKCTSKCRSLVSINVEEEASGIPIACPGSEAFSRVLPERVIFEMVNDMLVDLGVAVRVLFSFKIPADEVAGFPLFEGGAVLEQGLRYDGHLTRHNDLPLLRRK